MENFVPGIYGLPVLGRVVLILGCCTIASSVGNATETTSCNREWTGSVWALKGLSWKICGLIFLPGYSSKPQVGVLPGLLIGRDYVPLFDWKGLYVCF